MDADVIGNFPKIDPNCAGCGKPLTLENAWMTDGCPCNTPLGVNNMNETRWRLLMQLQQNQSHAAEKMRTALKFCGDLAEEELPHARVGTGAEVVLRHIVRRVSETI